MDRGDWEQVGTTSGLHDFERSDPHRVEAEQAYVFITDDDSHPIRIEGWQGYAVPAKLDLTRDQAKELAVLLIDAVTT